MSRTFLFELCADRLEAARAAQAGGADRIELCEELPIGGVTPSPELLRAVLDTVAIPVHVLIRPRGGDFVYSQAEIDQMRGQIEAAKAAGAAGVVAGVLLADGRIDVRSTRELIELARPLRATFHRAFDETIRLNHRLEEGVEDVAGTGADALLSSGGAPNVLLGAVQIGRLQALAGDRLEVIAGGGLTLSNLAETVRRSGVTRLHGSLSPRPLADNGKPAGSLRAQAELERVLERDLREAIRLLRQECQEPGRSICLAVGESIPEGARDLTAYGKIQDGGSRGF